MLHLRKAALYLLCIFSALSMCNRPSGAQAGTSETADARAISPQPPPSASGQPVAPSTEMQADLLMARGQFVAALSLYQQVQPRTAVTWNKMGIAYHHLYALDQALSDYKMAAALNPHYADAYNNIGTVYFGKREFSSAEKAYKRALKIQPRAACTYSNLGTLYFAKSKYKKGMESYRRAFAIDPEVLSPAKAQVVDGPASREQRIAVAFSLARFYASVGRKDQALASLRKALSEGFSDRKRLMQDKELASLRETPEFHNLLAEEHLQ